MRRLGYGWRGHEHDVTMELSLGLREHFGRGRNPDDELLDWHPSTKVTTHLFARNAKCLLGSHRAILYTTFQKGNQYGRSGGSDGSNRDHFVIDRLHMGGSSFSVGRGQR